MAKNFDGTPLAAEMLSGFLQTAGVQATVSEIDVVQTHDQISGTDKSGRHSNITRIAIKTTKPCPVTHLIIKRVACSELSDRPLAKWNRDITSYLTDVNFYKYFAAEVFPRCRVPRCFHYLSKHDAANSDPQQCWFYLILEDLESLGFKQFNYHELTTARALLEWMARFHSLYWERMDSVKAHLWEIGSATSLEKRDVAEIEKIPEKWEKVMGAWRSKYPDLFEQEEVKELGAKLKVLAPTFHDRLQQNTRHTALIHGDFKSANLFLHSETNEVGVVDYQWAGGGKVVRDLVYFMWGAVAPELIVNSEVELLHIYHEHLTKALGKDYPWEQFEADYQVAFLDYLRHVVAYMWPSLPVTPESCERELNVWCVPANFRVVLSSQVTSE